MYIPGHIIGSTDIVRSYFVTGSMLSVQHGVSDKVDSYAEVPGLHGMMDDMVQHFIG